MALYGPFVQRDLTAQAGEDGAQPTQPGFFCITDPATFAAHADLLTPYKVDPQLPAQNVLSGDDPAAPAVTITLHFADMVTTQEVMAQVNAPDVVEPPPLPAEVPMYRVQIVVAQQGWTADVQAYIAALPEPEKTTAQILWDRGDNLVVASAFAQGFKASKGLTDAQFDALIAVAVNLQL